MWRDLEGANPNPRFWAAQVGSWNSDLGCGKTCASYVDFMQVYSRKIPTIKQGPESETLGNAKIRDSEPMDGSLALSKALTGDELLYLRSQFEMLQPDKDGHVSFENFRTALLRNATDAMKESKVLDILNVLEPFPNGSMKFEEFCAATLSPYQLEALERWEVISSTAFQHFEQEGNRVISVEELAQEMNLAPSNYSTVQEWIRPLDGKLSFLGYTKFLHGVTIRSSTPKNT